MLTRLIINDFAIIDHLDLSLLPGLTILTGETGAGKSIILQALAFCLGAKSNNNKIRHKANKANVCAYFDLTTMPNVQSWLQQQLAKTDLTQCIIKRTISQNGRSQAYINEQRINLEQLTTLGHLLVSLHSQHAQQALMEPHWQQQILDEFAQLSPSVEQLRQLYQQWYQLRQQLNQLQQIASHQTQQQLWQYQLEELAQLNLRVDELAQLEKEHTLLAHADQQLQQLQKIGQLINDEEQGLKQQLNLAKQWLKSTPLQSQYHQLTTLFEQAAIYVDEAQGELNQQVVQLEINPARLAEIEARLTLIHRIARKYQCDPNELISLQQQLTLQLQQASDACTAITNLQTQINTLRQQFRELAQIVSKQRQSSAKVMSVQINQLIAELGMKTMHFTIVVTSRERAISEGIDKISFQLTNAPQLPLRPIQQVASGGELSRLNLAIAVIAAQHSQMPTLVFDEIDVGISGATAAMVGQLLQKLTCQRVQILCITHLAQVAATANQHLLVHKQYNNNLPQLKLQTLTHTKRIQELARLMSGLHISTRTLEHAEELFQQAQQLSLATLD